jgi:hypothetical protein
MYTLVFEPEGAGPHPGLVINVAVKREGLPRRLDGCRSGRCVRVAGRHGLGDHIGILGHCWGGRVAWLGACSNRGFKACIVCYGDRVKVAFADGGTPPLIWLSASPAP